MKTNSLRPEMSLGFESKLPFASRPEGFALFSGTVDEKQFQAGREVVAKPNEINFRISKKSIFPLHQQISWGLEEQTEQTVEQTERAAG